MPQGLLAPSAENIVKVARIIEIYMINSKKNGV
jgi:hypothetical protein